jgi:HD-GYP domain-containing protein (c-di-GMP phosphodiesterase class II)
MIDNRPLYSSRGIKIYIDLIRKKYNYVNINEILQYAKMRPFEIEDEGHYFTQEQIDLFYKKVVQTTGNKNIAREAGRFAASTDASGVLLPYVLGLLSTTRIYEMIGKLAPIITKSSIFKYKKLGSNKVEITVTLKEGVSEKLYQCENRIGYLEAAALVFKKRLPKVEHSECIFKGAKACKYMISWKEPPSAFWEKIRNYAIFFLGAICIISYFKYPMIRFTSTSTISLFIVLILTLIVQLRERKELLTAIDTLSTSIETIRGASDQLLESIETNYNNALMINEIGQALSKQVEIDSILAKVMHVLRERLDYDRSMILLANEDKTCLTFRAGFGYNDEQLSILKITNFNLQIPETKGVFIVSFREQKPFLINDISEIENTLSPHSMEFAKKMGARAFICCPIIYEETSLGILVVDNINTKRPLVQSDINLLMGIAPAIGISIHNAMVVGAKERQFKSIIQVLAATIDARDPMTAGHSEKVTEYSVGICKEMGLSKDYCEMIRVAALLHDYGKIGIKDAILKNEGKLSIEEYEHIKKHAGKTKEILEQINFEGIYKEVPEISGSHHEKIDGSGYPKGLRGEEIPLGARIIAVADVFEAITSKRLYRDPMSFDEALGFLNEKNGIYFDKRVVEAFISYYNRKNNRKS